MGAPASFENGAPSLLPQSSCLSKLKSGVLVNPPWLSKMPFAPNRRSRLLGRKIGRLRTMDSWIPRKPPRFWESLCDLFINMSNGDFYPATSSGDIGFSADMSWSILSGPALPQHGTRYCGNFRRHRRITRYSRIEHPTSRVGVRYVKIP